MAEFILKDWYNKEKTFNRDRIFVKGTDGKLIQFSEGTGDAPAVVQPLEVTENGTYTAPDGVDGYSPVTVAVPEPEINLQDKTITENGEYTADEGFDALRKVLVEIESGGGGTLVAKTGTFIGNGSTVTVEHNLGVIPIAFVCRATTGIITNASTPNGTTEMAIGFSSDVINLIGEKEYVQFVVDWNSTLQKLLSGCPRYAIDETGGTIYDASTTIIKIGKSDYPVQSGIEYTWRAIGLKTTKPSGGETVDLVETTAFPDFSNGDMVIEPSEVGKALSKVIIQKPETLVPENIAAGIDIAGIIGTFAASGSSAKMASGKISTAGGPITVEHGLGVFPDVVVVWVSGAMKSSIVYALGINKTLTDKLGVNACCMVSARNSSNADTCMITGSGLGATAGPYIHNVTEATFDIGNSTYPISTALFYPNWLAIGGLT